MIQNSLAEIRKIINDEIDATLPVPETKEARLIEAMRYSSIGTGKVLRPLLAVTVGDLMRLERQTAIRIGLAIELLHTYSLIHDDLPAMDNDPMRRGKPSNHIQFDEATAILAGDALQTKAFEVLLDPKTHEDPSIRADLAMALAKAAGAEGMAGGQMMDLVGEKEPLNLDEIERMQSLKTGALLHFSCVAPAIAVRADKPVIDALTHYAKALGLMFQITDDILDVEGNAEMVGKTLHKDSDAHKSTFVSILGLQKAKELAKSLRIQGKEALSIFGDRAAELSEILDFILERKK
ncbi:MAG: polyprenyl synthetase family protein [Alphaproteobacteria bacterium]|nr:polyprenyl synthetase family protein [Alphaproteobacteria bacterium]